VQGGVIASRVADEQTFRHLRLVRALRIRYRSLLGRRQPVSEVACHPGWAGLWPLQCVFVNDGSPL
jgi:hypothetical protein